MEHDFRDVSDAELSVLHHLWDNGPTTIRQLTLSLYPSGGDASYATVQKLLERLEDKGHVARDRRTHAHTFSAVTDRDTLVGHRLRVVAEKLTGGHLTPLLTHLLRAETISAADRVALRALIDDLDRKKPRTDRR